MIPLNIINDLTDNIIAIESRKTWGSINSVTHS